MAAQHKIVPCFAYIRVHTARMRARRGSKKKGFGKQNLQIIGARSLSFPHKVCIGVLFWKGGGRAGTGSKGKPRISKRACECVPRRRVAMVKVTARARFHNTQRVTRMCVCVWLCVCVFDEVDLCPFYLLLLLLRLQFMVGSDVLLC